MCERVISPRCTTPATTTVPMFMGSIKVCGQCALELTADSLPEDHEMALVTGDYVTVSSLGCTGIVKRVLGDALYQVEWAYLTVVDGAERLVEGLGVIARDQLALA